MRVPLEVVVLITAIGQLFGQAPSELTLNGLVLDASGASVAEAKVVLRKGGDSAERSTVTEPSGAFHFNQIARGDYEVEIRQDGFRPSTTHVRVGTRSPTPLRVVLAVAELRQGVTVDSRTDQVSTETSDNLNAISVSQQALENLPVFDQDYVTTMSRFLDAGAVGTNGVTLVVDGLESTRVPVSPSAIQEVKINQDPYSAEFSRPGRGRIEIITKPGSDEYHGTFNFLFRDSALNSRDPFALTRAPEQRRIFEGSLTGPVGHSKTTSFLITGNRQEEDLQAVVFALGPDGQIDQNVPTPQRNTEFSGSLNHLFGRTQLVSFRGLYTDRTQSNQGVGGFTLPEAGADFEDREDLFFLNHRGLITPKLVNQFRMLVFGRQHTSTKSLNNGPRIVVQDAFTGGGAQADRLQTENHFTITEVLGYSAGKHSIRGGINVPDISRRGLDDYTNFGGTYTFATLQDYLQHRPLSLVLQQGQGHLFFWEKVVGGFVQDEFRLLPNLQLTAGVRYDWQNYFHDTNNVTPRFSFAYAPGKQRRLVIRGGYGLFYDRTGPQPIFDLRRYDGQHLIKYIVSDPSFPFVPTGIGTDPPSIVRLDPTVKIPVTAQFGVGVERQLSKGATMAINYAGLRGMNLFRSRDINAPLPPFYLSRPNPDYSQIRQIESSADLKSHSLEVSLRGNLSRHFSGIAQYTLSRAYNNVGGTRTINTFPANSWNLDGEWARSDFDARHRFNLLGNVTPGRGFNFGVALALNSGMPYSITTGRDDNHDGLAIDRPAGIPRNSLQGPSYFGLDLRWSRDFFLSRSRKEKGPAITPALDVFNVLNRVNYTGYIGNLSSPFFGKPVAANPARRLQLSIRFRF
jgi:outer membrane receptor protein involved in Fe transport